MESIITIIPEEVVPNTLIETSDNTAVSCVQTHKWDLSLTKGQQELYDWKYATMDCFRDEFEDDSLEGYNGIFLEGYNTEDESKNGHKRIVEEILIKGRAAECLQS